MQRSGKISRCHWLGGVTDVNIKHKLAIWPQGNSSWKDPQEVSSPASCSVQRDSSGLDPVGLSKLQWWSLPSPILYCSREMCWIHSAKLPTGTVGLQMAPSGTPYPPGWTGSCLPASSHRASEKQDQFGHSPLDLFQLTNSFSVLAGELKGETDWDVVHRSAQWSSEHGEWSSSWIKLCSC